MIFQFLSTLYFNTFSIDGHIDIQYSLVQGLRTAGQITLLGQETLMPRTQQIIQSLIKHKLLTRMNQVSITPLTGGYHNYVYRLQTETNIDWVIKQYVTNSSVPLFPTLPDHEAGALQLFQGVGVAPDFVDYLPDAIDGPLLVYKYVDGDMWQEDAPSVARMLAKVHMTPLSGKFRYLCIWPMELVEQTKSILNEMNERREAEELLNEFMHDCEYDDTIVRCLVHTDCGPGNIIASKEGPRLIDWQCPGLGDAVEDLVNFTSPAIQIIYGLSPLTELQRQAFFEAYNNSEVKSRFDHIGNYYRLTLHSLLSFS